tara:strand:- start:113 stop:994 length:882 start_codon:yes stop_codon:yes gene_type:complete
MTKLLALFALLMSATVATASDEEAPTSRLYMESLLGGRINPKGLQERFFLSYRYKLSNRDHILFKDTHFSIGPVTTLTPGFGTFGAQVKVQPLAILGFRAAYEFMGTFGTFGQIHQFESLDVDYSDRALDDLGKGRKRIGSQMTLEGRFQIKLGPVAMRNTFMSRRYDLKSDAGQIAFYDQSTDLLAPTNGWIWTNDVDLLAVMPNGFTVGARWTSSQALHGTDDLASRATHRVGPILAYTIFNRPGEVFNTPTLFLITQWNAQHPYRTGEESSVFIPTVSVGFAFTGDLLPW